MRRIKYGNRKVAYNGIKFDSIGEKNRYIELKKLEEQGLITALGTQVKIELLSKFKHENKTIRAITYIADFRYFDVETGIEILEDFKGYETDIFKIKKKLLLHKIAKEGLNCKFVVTKKRKKRGNKDEQN